MYFKLCYRLLTMIEDSFSEESLTGDHQQDDDPFETHPSWFKQPQRSATAHVTPKSVLQQLVSRVDDLPACLIFYPVGSQPHSIQGTWLASKSEHCFLLMHSNLVSRINCMPLQHSEMNASRCIIN